MHQDYGEEDSSKRNHGKTQGASPPTARAALPFAGEQSEAAVVEGPVGISEEVRAGFADGFRDELFCETAGKLCGDGPAEHLQKIMEALLPIFESSGAFEEQGVSHFEVVTFEQRRIFRDARVVPRIRKGFSLCKILPSAAQSGHQAFDVALATEFGDETSTGLENGGDGGDRRFRVGDPVKRGVGEYGVELFGEYEFTDVHDFEGDGGMFGTCLLNHVRRAIDANNICAGGGDLCGEMAGAATDIEDAFAGLGFKEVEQAGSHFPDERVFFVVETGVPLCMGRRD